MKKKKKYLELYEEWLREGRLPEYGLCFSIPSSKYGYFKNPTNDPLFKLFEPETVEEYPPLADDPIWRTFWAADGVTDGRTYYHEFTPLRQTIVLFMAAMNGEL